MANIQPDEFAQIWNNIDDYPAIKDVAEELGISPKYCKKRAVLHRKKYRKDSRSVPRIIDRSSAKSVSLLPEEQNAFYEDMTPDELVNKLRGLYFSDPDSNITRLRFRKETGISDATWTRYFGTFLEFRRQAGLELKRTQHTVERQIARHVSSDHYREYNNRSDYDTRYLKDSNSKIKTIIGASDLHDEEVDPFYLRVFIETCRMVQPDIINLGGDIFDLAEFGKYGVDPREWDVVGKIKFVHREILEPLREACPDAQIDFVEGNHEFRLLRHLADATPALRSILSDLLDLSIPKLLGLDKYEVNYIAKADMSAFNVKDQKKEVGKSYIIYDEALLIHHHPHARDWGLPGWNGHHHHWKVFNMKNAIRGSYQWMQLGCGHRLAASYCEGEFWNMGFNIAHVNTQTKSVNHEYVSVTDFACVGGMYFNRREDEQVGFYARAA